MNFRTWRYINVFLTATLPFLLASVFTVSGLSIGAHWGQMNWLMQPLAKLSLFLAPLTWIIFVLMGVSWAQGKRLHKLIPILGLAIGPVSLVPWATMVIPIILLLPAIILAARLVIYHLEAPSNAQGG